MADFDVNADTRPALPYPSTSNTAPTIVAMKTAIAASDVSSSYPTATLFKLSKNDLIYICRTEGIAVDGITLPHITLSEGSAATLASTTGTLQLHSDVPGTTYVSATTAKATVGASTGLVTGVAAGTSVITASAEGYADATITITVPGA